MKTLNLVYHYSKSRLQIRSSLALLSVSFQIAGLFLDHFLLKDIQYGLPVMIVGFLFGFILMFLSSSVKEAFVNTLFFVGPLPILGILGVGLPILVALFLGHGNITEKLQNYISISAGILMIFAILAWPYILGPLALKALKITKTKND